MKAKTLGKKIVVALLVVTVIALALPISALFVSAEDPVFPDVGTMTDYANRIKFSAAHQGEYTNDNAVTITAPGENEVTFSGIQPKETGKIYQTVKMTFAGNVNYNTDSSQAYGRNGLIIGHYKNTGGAKVIVTISYRRNQGMLALWDSSSSSSTQKLYSGKGAKLNEVTISYAYDIETTELTLWFNGTYVDKVTMSTQFPEFTPDEFGYSSVVMGNAVGNAVTYSEMKVFGDWELDSSVLPTKDDYDGKDYGESTAFFSTDTWQEQYETDSTVTTTGGSSMVNGLLLKENGSAVFSIKATFNGNTNFNWNGSSYAPTYGRIGFRLGEYTTTGGTTKSLYANFRRCQNSIYLMDDSDALNGSQSNIVSIGSNTNTKSTVTEITVTFKYDSVKNKITVWVNGEHLKTFALEDGKGTPLNDFKFGPGFALTNPGKGQDGTTNSVTLSDMHYYGDIEVDDEVIAPKLSDYTNFADKLVFGSGDLNDEMKNFKSLTFPGNSTVTGDGIIFNDGFYCIGATLTFKGNVDFTWDSENGVWKNGWGKYGLKIGTYMSKAGIRKNVFVSFRRCAAVAYLFDDNNTVLGTFGGVSTKDVTSLDLLARYKYSTNSVSLWVNGKFLNTVNMDDIDDFIPELGFVTQGSGYDQGGNMHSTVFSNIRVYGDIEHDTSVYIPELETYKEGVTENLTKYLAISGMVDGAFSGGTGTYSFTGLGCESNGIYNMTCTIKINSRDLDAAGKEKAWTGPRFGFAKDGQTFYQESFMVGSSAVLLGGNGCNSPTSPSTIKTGETAQVAIQYDYQRNTVSVWLNGKMIMRTFKLSADDASFGANVTFEGCNCEITNLKIWGTGMYADISDEVKALLNDPMYASKSVPAMPSGNINLFQNPSLVQKGDNELGADYRDGVFTNYYADEDGEVRFTDAAGNRNINGIKNSSSFLFSFDYKVTAIDESHVGKTNGGEVTLRMYSSPSSQGALNGVRVKILENSVQIVNLTSSRERVVSSAKFTRETGKTYKIAILSSPDYTKVWVDGKLTATANFTNRYTFDLRYKALYTACEISNMKLYDVEPDGLTEIADYVELKAAKTGNTLGESVDIPLATRGISILVAAAGFVAVLSIAGIVVVTLMLIKKKKSSK